MTNEERKRLNTPLPEKIKLKKLLHTIIDNYYKYFYKCPSYIKEYDRLNSINYFDDLSLFFSEVHFFDILKNVVYQEVFNNVYKDEEDYNDNDKKFFVIYDLKLFMNMFKHFTSNKFEYKKFSILKDVKTDKEFRDFIDSTNVLD